MSEPKGLVWIFPNQNIDKKMISMFNERGVNEDVFLGRCESLIVIDLDKCVMYVANEETQKVLKLKEMPE